MIISYDYICIINLFIANEYLKLAVNLEHSFEEAIILWKESSTSLT